MSLKMAALLAALAGLMVFVEVGSASATELTDGSGMVTTGSTIAMSSEGTIILHPPIGDIECGASEIEGTIENTGSSSETVSVSLGKVTTTVCNATVTILKKGSLTVHTTSANSNNNGTVTSTGLEVTVEFLGFHCIFSTGTTHFGVLTGSATTGRNSTLHVTMLIPRTGGRSGAFCGTEAAWTGSYKVTSPSTLNVD